MKIELEQWLLGRLQGRQLLFVTFTSPMAVEKAAFSAAIPKLGHRIKRRVFGRREEDKELALVAVMERSYRHGFHAHLILEDPYSLTSTKAFPADVPISALIKEEWAALGIGGRNCAQDVQPVYDLEGAINYLLKTVRGASGQDALDINSLCLPDRSAT